MKLLCDARVMGVCHFMIFQTHRLYNTKRDPKVSYGLWMTVKGQCRIISLNKGTTMAWNGDRGVWEISVPPSQFCFKPAFGT